MKVLAHFALIALAALTLAPATAGAQHATPAAAPAASPRTAIRVQLPDTVLARIFFADGKVDISRDRFRRALAQFKLRPDSLTRGDAQQVLELLVQQRTLAHAASREPRAWSHHDSTDWQALSDRLTLTAALDSALLEVAFQFAARGDSIPDRVTLGIIARDSAMARIHPTYDEEMLEMLAADFQSLPKPSARMSVQEQMRVSGLLPRVTAADSARTLIASSEGRYTVGELLTDYARLNPGFRPPIRTKEDVRGVAESTIFEAMLRRSAAQRDLVNRPSIRNALAERAEYLDVQRYVARHAYDLVPQDSTTLRREFEAHRDQYRVPARAWILRGIYPRHDSADSAVVAMGNRIVADTLRNAAAADGRKYLTWLSEDADTALFAAVRRAGEGAVLGPDFTPDGWRVFRVLSFDPSRPQSFDEARDAVRSNWYNADGDRRTRALLANLQRSTLVNVNDAALARVVTAPRRAAAARAPHAMPRTGAAPRSR